MGATAAGDSASAAPGDLAAAHSAKAAALAAAKAAAAAAREREQKAALVWQQEKAAADALERDLLVAERHLAGPSDTPLLPAAGDTFEASTIASLHAQAADVQDIRSLVPVVLDVSSGHYARWRDLVMLTLQRYALDDHVTSDAAASGLPCWRRMDSVVLSWLIGTLTVDLQDSVRERGGTAR